MKEAFKKTAANTKQRRDMDKRKRDQKARLQPLKMGGRVLVRNLSERGGSGKTKTFLEQRMYEDGLVYVAQEESNPHPRVTVL